MIKHLSQIEVIIENKICRFQTDFDTPLTHVKEALFQMQKYVGQIEDQAKAELASKEKEKENGEQANNL